MGTQPARNRPQVVVGVDGSPISQLALDWAVEHAARLDAEVTAVAVCPVPLVAASAVPGAPPATVTPDPQPYRELLHTAVETASRLAPAVKITQVVEIGQAGLMLCARAKDVDATLLVLGSHGHGPVLRALLGSVSAFCVQHAPCPVLVLPAAQLAIEPAGEPAGHGRR